MALSKDKCLYAEGFHEAMNRVIIQADLLLETDIGKDARAIVESFKSMAENADPSYRHPVDNSGYIK